MNRSEIRDAEYLGVLWLMCQISDICAIWSRVGECSKSGGLEKVVAEVVAKWVHILRFINCIRPNANICLFFYIECNGDDLELHTSKLFGKK